MKNTFSKLSIILILFSISSFSVSSLLTIHKDRSNLSISWLSKLPHATARFLSLEYAGITSDFLLINTLTFLGEKTLRNNNPTTNEWKMVHKSLLQNMNLDPRSNDAYVLAETTLPWEAGLITETNEILEIAANYRPMDPRPNFFLWFNHFYFLNDPSKAGNYLQKAAKIPGVPPHYVTLSARMHLLAGQHQAGIKFLEEMIKETIDPKQSVFLQRRLSALRRIEFLEQNILRYKYKYKEIPKSLDELVRKNLIKAIPPDPYGGEFYIMENGRVNSTSDLVLTTEK